MPITKSAKDALRKDRKRTKINRPVRDAYKQAVKLMRKEPTAENLKKAYSQLDKAVKGKIIHKIKANRLKSRLTKFFNQVSQPAKVEKKPVKGLSNKKKSK